MLRSACEAKRFSRCAVSITKLFTCARGGAERAARARERTRETVCAAPRRRTKTTRCCMLASSRPDMTTRRAASAPHQPHNRRRRRSRPALQLRPTRRGAPHANVRVRVSSGLGRRACAVSWSSYDAAAGGRRTYAHKFRYSAHPVSALLRPYRVRLRRNVAGSVRASLRDHRAPPLLPQPREGPRCCCVRVRRGLAAARLRARARYQRLRARPRCCEMAKRLATDDLEEARSSGAQQRASVRADPRGSLCLASRDHRWSRARFGER